MYLATFKLKKKCLLGCKVGDNLIHLNNAYRYVNSKAPPQWFLNMRTFLSHSDGLEEVKKLKEELAKLIVNIKDRKRLTSSGILYPLDDVKLTAPILNPDKIICIGLNYKDHCREQNRPLPEYPILFSKFRTAIVGPEDNIVKPKITRKLDYEGELAFIIAKEGKHIQEEKAMDYIAGYTIFNDVTARDIQFSDRQWLRGKTFDTFAPMGPFLATRDEIKDPHNLNIKVEVNGKVMQDSNTGNMVHRIPYLVSFISQVLTFSPGDIVATGTPAGVGVFRKPPVFLKKDDEVTIKIDRLGNLSNRVIAE